MLKIIKLHTRALFLAGTVATCAPHVYADCASDLPPATLSMQAATERLISCNRDLIEARRAVASGEADVLVAGERPNPNLTLGVGSVSPRYGIGAGNYWDKTFDTSVRYEQLFERGNKRELRVKSTENLVRAAKENLRGVEKQQHILLSNLMVDLAALDARITLLTEVTDLDKQALQASTKRFEKSDIPKLDVDRQNLDMNRALIDLKQAKTAQQAKNIELAKLLGWENYTGQFMVDKTVLDVSPDSPKSFEPTLYPEVKAAQARVDSATAARDLALAQKTRDITAGLQYDHWPTSANNTNGTGDTVSVTIGIPLYVNHQYEGELARATSDLDSANEYLQRTKGFVASEWHRLTQQVENANERLNLLQQNQLPKAEEVTSNIDFGYKKGAIDLLDLLDAKRLLRQTKLDVLDAKADLARSILEQNEWIRSNATSTQ